LNKDLTITPVVSREQFAVVEKENQLLRETVAILQTTIREFQEEKPKLEETFQAILQVTIREFQEEKAHLEATLQATIREFQEEKANLEATFQAILQATLREFQEEKAKLEATFQEEKDKVIQENNTLKERLGLNSTNSSLPPSRDLYAAKNKDKPKSGRKPGGQPGHPGYRYQPLPADEIIDCLDKKCSCGHKLEKLDSYASEQKVEIPPIKPYVKEYRRWHQYCAACDKKRVASLPEGVQKDLLGNHAKAIITGLNGFYHNSKRDVQVILKDIFNLDISLGLISNTAKRVNQKLEPHYEHLHQAVLSGPYIHGDETGHKSKGKKGWAWVFTSRENTLLKLTNSRATKVVISMIGNYQGKVISDRYGAYNYFKAENRQLCWSHLARDFERFAHSKNPTLAEKGKILVEISKEVFDFKKALTREQIKEDIFLLKIDELSKKLKNTLESILSIKDVSQGHGVVKRLLKSFEMFWLFVKDKAIEMTNNLAERQIRKYVTYRKKLLFTWSTWGNEYVERILSLYLSCRLKKENSFALLLHCINTA
jgi:transposase